MSSGRNKNLSQLTLCAVLIALATVLGMITFLHLPYGGSITLLSMLAAVLCGYCCGTAKGLLACFALGLVNMILDPVMLHPVQVALDYFLGFGVMGLSGLTANMKNGLTWGYIIAVVGRFICSFLSGFVFFAEYAPEGMHPVIYSFLYNITYIGVEAIITIIIINIPVVKKNLERLKEQFQ